VTDLESPHAVLIFQRGRLVHANSRSAELCGFAVERLRGMRLEDALALFSSPDRERLNELFLDVHVDGPSETQVDCCLQRQDGRCIWVDVLVNRILFQGAPASQMVWIDNSPRREIEDQLRQHVQRLQILHEIDHAALSVQSEHETAAAALRYIGPLVPGYRLSMVCLVDPESGQAELLASDGGGLDFFNFPESLKIPQMALVLCAADLERLQQNQPFIIQDLKTIANHGPVERLLLEKDIRSVLSAPLCWGEALHGLLNLYSASPDVFTEELAQIAQEIADSLAVAIQQAHLRQAEQQRRQEAEVMRDLMAALASAGNLKQTLEAVLVNLHNVIRYDRASLFLVNENEQIVNPRSDTELDHPGRAFSESNPLVNQLRQAKEPVIVSDIQGDPRFEGLPDLQSVHGWLGAPLYVGDEMIGFLSLGSLEPDAYNPDNAERLRVFAAQVAQVLEKAWLNEQTQRRSEELEVLSNISFALGQAETGENTLFAVAEQVARFFNAQSGVFLFPDRNASELVVKASLNEASLGLTCPVQDDLIWQTYNSGEASLVPDFRRVAGQPAASTYRALFGVVGSFVLVPLKSAGDVFGVLGFGFDRPRRVSAENVHLFKAVAEIVGASLRRAVVLEGLEKQVDIRTQHLSTLYEINAIASEPLNLESILTQVLKITLESMTSQIGTVHFLDEEEYQFNLAAQIGLADDLRPCLEKINARERFWSRLLQSSSPLVIPDTTQEMTLSGSESVPVELPAEFATLAKAGQRAFIGAPIRAKGQVLGLLSLFDRTILDYSLEDITLFMTIADQIGSSVERARLMKQAEIAAVIQERQRLARELHDSVTQLLYSQVLFAGAGLKVLHQGDSTLAEQHLARIDQAAQQALKEMRLLVYQLRPSDYLDEGLVGALERRLQAVEKRTSLNARLIVEGKLNLDEAEEVALYRIAEEALNNTLKHAQAQSVSIILHGLDSRVILEIVDDGIGFEQQQAACSGGVGLSSMRERTAALGGQIEIHSQPGHGTHILVTIEVPQ
jgi:PAS domain S-box-containing protein